MIDALQISSGADFREDVFLMKTIFVSRSFAMRKGSLGTTKNHSLNTLNAVLATLPKLQVIACHKPSVIPLLTSRKEGITLTLLLHNDHFQTWQMQGEHAISAIYVGNIIDRFLHQLIVNRTSPQSLS
jgi:hypothetical protein